MEEFEQEVKDKIDSNPEANFIHCQPDEFSNFKECIKCEEGYDFNIQTKECVFCDGSLDAVTHKCKLKVYLFTNLNAKKITNLDVDREEEQQKIDSFLETHPTSKVCPEEKPYSNNKSCIACGKD